jgi:hypothetical protein
MCESLHSKVWLADGRCILGSVNASANGLAQEGHETDRLIEANILIDDESCVKEISDWYERTVRKAAAEINDKDIKLARERWKSQRGNRPNPKSHTLLDALQKDRNAMSDKDIFVYVRYELEDLDKEAKAVLRHERKLREDKSIDAWDLGDPEPQLFTPPGSHVIEFEVHRTKKPQLLGVRKLLLENYLVVKKKTALLLYREVQKVNSLPLGNLSVWKAAVVRAQDAVESSPLMNEVFFGSITEFAQFLLNDSGGGTS